MRTGRPKEYVGGPICSKLYHYMYDYMDTPFSKLCYIKDNEELFIGLTNCIRTLNEFTFYHTYETICKKFVTGNVLTYLPTFRIYQLFDNIEKYGLYVDRISNSKYKTFPIKQLVLISEPHKFIVCCNDDEVLVNKISNTIGGIKPEIIKLNGYLQLMFNKPVSSVFEDRQLFEIISDLDPNIYIPKHKDDNKFLEVDVCHHFTKYVNDNIEKIEELIKKIDDIKPSITIGNTTNSSISFGNGNIINKVNTLSDKDTVRRWIANHPFEGRIEQSLNIEIDF